MRIPAGSKGTCREDGCGGTINRPRELCVSPGRNPDRIRAIEDDVVVLTDENNVVPMVKQKGEYRSTVTQQL